MLTTQVSNVTMKLSWPNHATRQSIRVGIVQPGSCCSTLLDCSFMYSYSAVAALVNVSPRLRFLQSPLLGKSFIRPQCKGFLQEWPCSPNLCAKSMAQACHRPDRSLPWTWSRPGMAPAPKCMHGHGLPRVMIPTLAADCADVQASDLCWVAGRSQKVSVHVGQSIKLIFCGQHASVKFKRQRHPASLFPRTSGWLMMIRSLLPAVRWIVWALAVRAPFTATRADWAHKS